MLRQILLALCLACCSWAASLQWQASLVDADHPAPEGYRIHRGTAPGVYDAEYDAGNVLQWPIPDDWYGSYYFVASAYLADRRSGYSNEVFWQRAPPEPPQYVGATDLTASRYQVGSTEMGWTHIETIYAENVGSGTSLQTSSSTLNIAAGDLIIAFGHWEDGTSTASISDGGSNALTMKTPHEGSGSWGVVGYKINASANATAAFTLSLGTARAYRGIIVSQFRPDAGETVTEDAFAENDGASDPIESGTISPTGDDIVVWAAGKNYASSTFASKTIGGSAPTGYTDLSGLCSIWYTIYTSSQTNIKAAATSSGGWVLDIIAFKSASGGGASAVPAMMRSYRARRN